MIENNQQFLLALFFGIILAIAYFSITSPSKCEQYGDDYRLSTDRRYCTNSNGDMKGY